MVTNIASDRVMAQLERILASSEFVAGKRLGQFLRYVVMQSLNGQSGSIKQYTVAVDAFGYGADFDPQSNPIVRIEAQRLRRALDQYYYSQGIEDPIRIDIPKGSYIPVFADNLTTSKAPGSSECPSPVPAQTPLDLSEPAIAVVMFENLDQKDQNSFFARGLTAEILFSLT
jgi:TolB-like protein